MTLGMEVCVIGAGPSGLTAAKACLEAGLRPEILEQREHLGGFYSEPVPAGIPCWSRDLIAFSDFHPNDFPPLPQPADMARYLQQYAAHFRLPPVRTSCQVTQVEPHQDSRWKVTSRWNGETQVEYYDAVLVCAGRIPRLFSLPSQEKFQGPVLHIQNVASVADLRDQCVLVVGLEDGGLELACKLTSVAAQVYLSVEKGAWLLPRVLESGTPMDMMLLSRWVQLLPRTLCWRGFAPLPLGPPDHTHPPLLVNGDFRELLLSKALQLRGPLKSLTATGAEFETGEPCELDSVVVAAGRSLHFPFLDRSLVSVEKDCINLYKHVFPAQLSSARPTLAFIGTVNPCGPRPPVAELQSRWAVHVLTGKGAGLPNAKQRWTEVSDRALKAAMKGLPPLFADWVAYLDELAVLVGCRPSLISRIRLYSFPCLPLQYRMRGPHAMPQASLTLLNHLRSYVPRLPLDILPEPPPSRHPAPIKIFHLLLIAFFLLVILAVTTT